ncbi:MAG TPA: outer membrane beta-barrel protein [Gammaproteobacteria bacterium]|nr:outer membrane beta-barrel protein [Gammaproteobacteria bacterium]
MTKLINLLAVAAFAGFVSLPVAAHADSFDAPNVGHQGLFLNMDIGLTSGKYSVDSDDTSGSIDLKGNGAELDFRIGGFITPHLALTGDISANAISDPDCDAEGMNCDASGSSVSTALIGPGLTYYFDNNLFIGVTLGSGKLSYDVDNASIDSDRGFGYQLRIGHEWQVNDDWGLGIVGGVTHVSADINLTVPTISYGSYGLPYYGTTEVSASATSTSFFVAFTASFN